MVIDAGKLQQFLLHKKLLAITAQIKLGTAIPHPLLVTILPPVLPACREDIG